MDLSDLLNKNTSKDLKVEKLVLKDDFVKLNLIDADEKYNLSLSIDDYYDLKVKKNDFLSYEQYKLYKEKENLLLAYKSAIRRLGIKDYSSKMLINSLKQKYELSDNQTNELINKLKDLDYLDDVRYCKNRIENLISQGKSKRMIYQKLMNEGISSYLIDKYYPKDENAEIENIKDKADKYLKSIKNKSVNAKRQAIITKLSAQGFDLTSVKDIVSKLDFKEDLKEEKHKLEKEFDKALCKYSKKYLDYELKNKVFNCLLSKGFKSEDINDLLKGVK